jgi:F0F1-type ATP synthase epsilon subunit
VADTTKTFQCTVIAPQGKLLECHAHSVIIPSHDGQLGILPGHMPIFCQLGLGPMEVHCAAEEEGKPASHVYLLIDGGFAMFNSNSLAVTAAGGVNISHTTPEKLELLTEKYKADLAAATPGSHRIHMERRLSLLAALAAKLAGDEQHMPQSTT